MGADAGEVDGTSLNELVEDAIKAYTPETMWNGKRILKRGGEFDWNHVFDFCDALKTENAKTTSWSNSIWTEYNTTALNRNNYKLGVDTNGNVTVQTDWKDCAANGNDKHTSGRGCLDNFITIMNGLCQQANAFDLTSSSSTFPRFEIGKGTATAMFDEGLALKEMNAWASYIEKDPDGPHREKTNDDATVTLKGNAQKPEFIVSFQGTKSTDSSMVHYSVMNDPVYTCLGTVCNIVKDGYFQYMNGLKGCLDDFVDNHVVLANSADDSFDGNTMDHAHTTFITGHSLGAAAATIYAQTRPLHSWQPKNDGTYESSFGTTSVDAKLFPRLVVFGTPPTGYKGFKAVHPDTMVEDQGYSNKLGNTIECIYPTGQGHMKHALLPTSPSSTDDFGYVYGICSAKSGMSTDPFNDDYGLYMTETGFGTYQSTHGGSSGYCGKAMKQSVGFMHKFDAFASMPLVGQGQYGHSQEFHVMLMDKYMSNCDVTHGFCALTSGTLDTDNYDFTDLANERKVIMGFDVEVSNPYLLTQYLCTKLDTEPIAWGFKCNNNLASYMSLMNPAPCALIELVEQLSDFLAGGQLINDLLNFEPHSGDVSIDNVTETFFGGEGLVCMWGMHGKVSCYDIYSIDNSIFKSFESTTTCIEDWAASSEIYVEMSIADNWQYMGALFSMTIHSAYGFYPLCITGASTDRINYDGGEAPKSYWGASGSTITDSYEDTEASCKQSEYDKIDAHCMRGEYMNWGDCISASDFHRGVSGGCVPCCHAGWEADLTDTAAYCGSSASYNCWV